MIVVQLLGGLGNQMFQYACGRALALRTGKQLFLDVGCYSVYSGRRYELDVLNIQANIINLEEDKEIGQRLGIPGIPVYSERHYNFDHNVFVLRDSVFLQGGFWQTEKYFQDFASVIREELSPKLPSLSAESLNIARDIKKQLSIAIHVRRTDYAIYDKLGFLPMGYYENVRRYLETVFPAARYYVFSDDVAWCKREFTVFPNAYVVERKGEVGCHEDLWLMSQCQHNVIANSTYSWWGAWLNDNSQKLVIAPDRWFAGEHLDTQDLLPDKWIKIPVQNSFTE
ncbi:O-antigen biosynthesis glycosyltransferase WbnK [Sporomusa rhizae]|uniref:alpha-1,2-fucosyltransferase n=1 Tax=Sporomusa rhizae TaxID=357999 RepID=UPI00352BB4EA